MNTPVINVNGQPVTRFELTNAMQDYALQMHDKPLDELEDEQLQEIHQMSVEKLVVWELVYQQSVADGGTVDQQDIEKEIDGIAQQFDSREELFTKLGEVGIDQDLMGRSVRREILVGKVFERMFDDIAMPTDAEMDAGYQEYLASLEPADADSADDGDDEGEALSRDEAEPMIRSYLTQRAGAAKIRVWVDELRESAEIEYLPEL